MSEVSGTWVLRGAPGDDDTHTSSMYDGLHTNLPTACMAFPSFPYNDDVSFPHHTSVRTYLERYADASPEVRSLIRFNTPVLEIKPIDETIDGSTELNVLPKWQVITSTQARAEVYDAVVVCNGHYSKPFKPEIAGVSVFPGRVWHSHTYREPSVFEGQRVLVLGAAASGVDICREIATTANAVYISHRTFASKAGDHFPNNANTAGVDTAGTPIVMCPQLRELGSDGSATFEAVSSDAQNVDGAFHGGAAVPTLADIDTVLLCTGYEYHFEFLRGASFNGSPVLGDCTGETHHHGSCVTPLAWHLFHSHIPNLSFVGLPFKVVPFRLFEYQAELVARVLKADVPLKRILDSSVQACSSAGITVGNLRHHHLLGDEQWEYCRNIVDLYGGEVLDAHVEEIYNDLGARRAGGKPGYRRLQYDLLVEPAEDEEGSKPVQGSTSTVFDFVSGKAQVRGWACKDTTASL
jgi:thioredoxin reductase